MGAGLTAVALVLALADLQLAGEKGGVDARALADLVELELGPAERTIDRIVVRIEGKAAFVEIIRKDRSRSGSVALADGQVERTIALFASELARRFETEPDAVPTAPSAPAATAPEAAAAPAPSPLGGASRLTLSATMGARLLVSKESLMPTPRVEVGLLVSKTLRLGASARYGYASEDDALGSVHAHALVGGLGATFRFADWVATGPRFELGAIAAGASGTNASSASALATSASWEIELCARVFGSFAVVLAPEVGWYLSGLELRADDRSVLEIRGGFLGLSLGGALLPH